jgi:hypothetical protein
MRLVLQNQPQIGNLGQFLLDSLRNLVTAIQTGWSKQHSGDGTHAAVTATSLAVSGVTTLGRVVLNQITLDENTLPLTGGTINNLTVAGLHNVSCLRVLPVSSPLILTGIDATGRQPGELLLVLNCDDTLDPGDIWLNLEDAGSLAANRFATSLAGTSPVIVQGARGVLLCYDYQRTGVLNSTRLPRWRVVDQA